MVVDSIKMSLRIGLYAGGIEQYWKETGMKRLKDAVDRDAKRLKDSLSEQAEVIYPQLAENVSDSKEIGKIFRQEEVDIALMYHSTYLDDAMSLGFLNELGRIFPVIFHSQGLKTFCSEFDLIDAGRCWGNNSAVQITGTLKRMYPELRYGYVFGNLNDGAAISQIVEYARAARAVKKLSEAKIGIFPHRSLGVPMYDIFPDETLMMAQAGVRFTYLYIQQLIEEMKRVKDKETELLGEELYRTCEVIEPTREEVYLAAKQALGLERMVESHNLDALAIDMVPGIVTYTGMVPCIGMARLIDKGIVVTTEGDLNVAIVGILIRNLVGKPIHFWEHLMFDREKNWVLGGHEGGSAGFSMAKKGTKIKLRNTQYVNFEDVPGAPYNGVLPEFITEPGPATLVTMFRAKEAYEMRIARGESANTDPFPVHYEHTVFKPAIELGAYFKNIASLGVCHHFALVQAEISSEIEKVAHILGMELRSLT